MIFPKWVNKPRTSKRQQAANRLRYLILHHALEMDPKGSMQKVCDKVGVTHATVLTYIKRGQFSPAMAAKFEDTFGRDVFKSEWLRDPMLIPTGK